ncbi:hypothetical protein OG900_31025 [Streptomyces sp. NBC_00433]
MTDLPERLRNAADAHRPDRERMLARVEHAMAADDTRPGVHGSGARGHDRPPAAPWMRVTAVTAAVAGAIGIGGLAVGAVTGDNQPTGTVVTSGDTDTATSPAAQSATSGSTGTRAPVPRHTPPAPGHRRAATTPHGTPGRKPPAALPSKPPSASAPGTTPGPSGGHDSGAQAPTSDGPLSSNGVIGSGSNDYWTQSDVDLATTQTLTSLTVELRIARNSHETSTNSWTTVPGGPAAQVTVEGQDLVYRWTLNAGQTLAPGTYTFSGQFSHDPGQGGTDGDGYTVTARYGSGSSAQVSGIF